jgi:hypothetical protein
MKMPPIMDNASGMGRKSPLISAEKSLNASSLDTLPRFSCQWQSWIDGTWHDYHDTAALLRSDAWGQLGCFEEYGPAIIAIDGGYLCSSSIYPEIRKKCSKVKTFKALLKTIKPDSMGLRSYLGL